MSSRFSAMLALLLMTFSASGAKPNLIFVMADDLGVGHLGSYGQKLIRTPNLDRMSAEGMRFTQAYAGSGVCAPSRSVLMTGLHTGHTPIRANGGGDALLPEDVTVAEVLRGAGYATGLFGKWGLGDAESAGVPSKQGFDEYLGYLHQVHAHRYYVEYLWHNDRKRELPGNQDGQRGTYAHDVIWDAGLDFVRRHKDRPFFLYLAPTIPHVELIVPEDSLAEYSGKFEETPFADPRPGYAAPKEPKATIAAMVTRLDRDMGRMFALLKELKIDENTLVIFTSDNGAQGGYGCHPEFFNATAGLRGLKTQLYEGGIRVPLIAWWPGKIKGGTATDEVWCPEDLMPTAGEIAGAKLRSDIDGVSVLPTLTGQGEQLRPAYRYWELQNGPRAPFMQAVRIGNLKAIRPRPNLPVELYDLKSDPSEARNVASQHPDVVKRAEQVMKDGRTTPRPLVPAQDFGGRPYR